MSRPSCTHTSIRAIPTGVILPALFTLLAVSCGRSLKGSRAEANDVRDLLLTFKVSASSLSLRSDLRLFPLQLLTFNGLSARVRISINPRHLRSLCFHTVTHSFAPSKTLSPIVSCRSTLFSQNTGRGIPSQPRAGQSLDNQPPSRLVSLPPYFITSLPRPMAHPLKPLPHIAHPYTCTCKKGPAAREPRYSPCAAS